MIKSIESYKEYLLYDKDREYLKDKVRRYFEYRRLLNKNLADDIKNEYHKVYDLLMNFMTEYDILNKSLLLSESDKLGDVIFIKKSKQEIQSEADILCNTVNYYTIKFKDTIPLVFEFNDKDTEVEFIHGKNRKLVEYKNYDSFEEVNNNKLVIPVIADHIANFVKLVLKEYRNIKLSEIVEKHVNIEYIHVYSLYMKEELTYMSNGNDYDDNIHIIPENCRHVYVTDNKFADIICLGGNVYGYMNKKDRFYSFNIFINVTYSDYNYDGEISVDKRINPYIYEIIKKKYVYPFGQRKGWLYDLIYNTMVDFHNLEEKDDKNV